MGEFSLYRRILDAALENALADGGVADLGYLAQIKKHTSPRRRRWSNNTHPRTPTRKYHRGGEQMARRASGGVSTSGGSGGTLFLRY